MRKRREVKLPDGFNAMLAYLRKMEYKESSIYYFENRFRAIVHFMEMNGYEAYTYTAYTAYLETITGGREYHELQSLEKRHYRTATILYQFQQTGSFTFRHPKGEKLFSGGIKEDIEEFVEYRKSLLQSEATRRQYHRALLCFNCFLNDQGIQNILQITNTVILQYVQERMSQFTPSTIRYTLTMLRQFFLYLYENGKTEKDLSLIVPRCGARPPQKVPSAFSKDEISLLLGAMNRADAKGKRDYAMILIASRLGLRSSDICQLKFSELDWARNRIVLKQKKTGVEIELPLLAEIGEAIIDYLKYGRPHSELPYVFLKHIPPYGAVTGAAFTNAIKMGMRCVGIPHSANKSHGPHALRHSLAAALLEKNTPLPVISGILGHKNPETTKIYLSIDLNALSKCALDVPELAPGFYEGRRMAW